MALVVLVGVMGAASVLMELLDGVMDATVVLLGVSRDAQQNRCRTHHAIRTRRYVFEKHITFSKSHCRATSLQKK